MRRQILRSRRAILTGLALAGGAGLLFASHELTAQGQGEWWAGVLVNVGTSVFLAAPLVYLAVALEKRLELGQRETDNKVTALSERVTVFEEHVERRLDEAAEAVSARLAVERDRDEAAFRALAETPTRSGVREALARAQELGLVSERRGPRVAAFADADVFVRFDFTPAEDGGWREESLGIGVERVTGANIGWVTWPPEIGLEDALGQVGRLVQKGTERGRDMDLTAVMRGLREALDVAYSSSDRRPILQLCPPQWCVTEYGIASYGDGRSPYSAGFDYLKQADASAHLHSKGGIDHESLDDALHAAAYLGPGDEPPF